MFCLLIEVSGMLSHDCMDDSASSSASTSSGEDFCTYSHSGRFLLIRLTLVSSISLHLHGQWSSFGLRKHLRRYVPILWCSTCSSVLIPVLPMQNLLFVSNTCSYRIAPILWCYYLLFGDHLLDFMFKIDRTVGVIFLSY